MARFLSIGNQADVDIAEVIDYLVDDPATTLIACFVEALRDGRRFVAAAPSARPGEADRRAQGRPLGRRPARGRLAHRARWPAPTTSFAAACDRRGRRAGRGDRGVLRRHRGAGDDRRRAPGGAAASPSSPSRAGRPWSPPTPPSARGLARARRSARPRASRCARCCRRSPRSATRSISRPRSSPRASPPRCARLRRSREVAGAVAVNVGLDFPEFADGVVAAARATGKPAVAFAADAPGITARFRAGGVPVLPSPERAVRAWRALWQRAAAERRARPPGAPLPRRVLPRLVATARAAAVRASRGALLEAYGVRFCREAIGGHDRGGGAARPSRSAIPVVVKADARGTHPQDRGGRRRARRARRGGRARGLRGRSRRACGRRSGSWSRSRWGRASSCCWAPGVTRSSARWWRSGAGGVLTEVMRDVVVPAGAAGRRRGSQRCWTRARGRACWPARAGFRRWTAALWSRLV